MKTINRLGVNVPSGKIHLFVKEHDHLVETFCGILPAAEDVLWPNVESTAIGHAFGWCGECQLEWHRRDRSASAKEGA